jgi:hypothetical protein
LEERRTFLSIQETNLERRKEKLMEEQAHGLHSFDGRDLSTVLEEIRSRMVGIEDECATEAVRLSRLAMEISDALINLGVFPIRDTPPSYEVSSGGLGVDRSHFGAPARGTCLQGWSMDLI